MKTEHSDMEPSLLERLSVRQEAVLKGYVDSLLPPLQNMNYVESNDSSNENENVNQTGDDSAIQRYWEYRLSEDEDFIKTVSITIIQKMSVFDRISLLLLLYIMDTRIGTCLLFNHYTTRFPKRFLDYSEYDRTNILLPKLQNSSYSIQRKVFQSLKRLLLGIAYTYHTTATMKYKNPFWEAMGYRGSPIDWPKQLFPNDEEGVDRAMQEQQPIIGALNQSQEQIALQISSSSTSTKEETIELQFDCDILIVGSGSGGCVAAHVLAKAGYNVIVLEQGKYLPPKEILQHEIFALDQQYVQSGLLQNTSGTVMILAGNALGGGTAINWSCCLPLPSYVRDEWSNQHQLHETFRTDEYDASLQSILNKLGMYSCPPSTNSSNEQRNSSSKTTTIPHNRMNKKLQQGCTALGFAWEETGQNLRNPGDSTAGFVGMGDRYGNKNGGIQSFLVEAVQGGNTRIFDQCHVERICRTSTGYRQRATGVECRIMCSDGKCRRMVVHARRRVIIAAGALYSPCLLRKSGLCNSHIGKHLRLHPVAAVMGFYPRDEPSIDSILGAPMTTVCNEFANGSENNGYGAKIECPCPYPGLLAAGSPWISPLVCKERLLQYRNSVPLVVLQRDSGDGGSVKQSLDGKTLVIDYEINPNDIQSMLRSIQGATRILVASGAEKVMTGHIHDKGYKVETQPNDLNPDENDRSSSSSLQEYLVSIATRGTKDYEIGFFSAHQMGSCRMSASSSDGVVDLNGETWECDDLFVMDSSVFPTAAGSNPMVTVMTISHLLSTRLVTLLTVEDSLSNDSSQNQQNVALNKEELASAMKLYARRAESRQQSNSRPAIAARRRILLIVAPIVLAVTLTSLYKKWKFI